MTNDDFEDGPETNEELAQYLVEQAKLLSKQHMGVMDAFIIVCVANDEAHYISSVSATGSQLALTGAMVEATQTLADAYAPDDDEDDDDESLDS